VGVIKAVTGGGRVLDVETPLSKILVTV